MGEATEDPGPGPVKVDPFPVVAMGASAAGVEALRKLLARLPEDLLSNNTLRQIRSLSETGWGAKRGGASAGDRPRGGPTPPSRRGAEGKGVP